MEGVDVTRASVYRRVDAGLVRTFQTPRLFDEMTIAENIEVAACARRGKLIRQLYISRNAKRQIRADVQDVLEVLGLEDRAQTPCSNLEFGPRRLAEVGRALALHPRLLLLDEPVAGMNPAETAEFASLVRSIRDDGITMVIIDHDVDFILGLCEHCTVLDLGRVIATGTPEQIRSHPTVVNAYLGTAT
jgi:branched-chain amino acid transport system ATP-binding protein